jgi:dipeptidyl aminopeptidase/acylaminoacyl peptidase
VSSPVYWVTRGYVVLSGAAFPIVGEGDEEPNDSFRRQLVANAKAAIDAVDALGYIDRDRVGVGGHSYGAFMVANSSPTPICLPPASPAPGPTTVR